MVPHKTPSIFKQLMPSRLWQINTSQKKIYLTFDDGPIPGLTDWLLDLLKEKDVKATFFCVGENVEKHPDLFQRIIHEGHAVGNHTYNHLNGFETNLDVYLDNVSKADEALKKFGVETSFFRPPYGRLNYTQRKRLDHKKIVMWDVLSKDYLKTLSKEKVLAESIKATEKGSIVVFHDNWKAEINMKYAVPKYIDHFKSLDFRFEILS